MFLLFVFLKFCVFNLALSLCDSRVVKLVSFADVRRILVLQGLSALS